MSHAAASTRLVDDDHRRRPGATRARRIESLATLPVFFKLAGRRAVIAGETEAALWKAELLAAAGAHVDVYADSSAERFQALAADPPAGSVKIHERAWVGDDLRGAAIAIADAADDIEASAFAGAARAAGVPVNVIDRPAFCDFQFGAIVNRSPLVVSISTDGAAPVFSQRIRAKIEALLPHGFRFWAEAARDWRLPIQGLGLSFARRRRFWERFCQRAFGEPTLRPKHRLRDELLKEASVSYAEKGRVTLVGAGPGDPDLLTLKAVQVLHSAEVILYDDLVSPQILDFARREAKRILVSDSDYGRACKQDDINNLMLRLASQGRQVVRLTGGDAAMFGRVAEEIEACRRAGIDVTVVPDISAAQTAAPPLSPTKKEARRPRLLPGRAKDDKWPADPKWGALAEPSVATAHRTRERLSADLRDEAIGKGLLPCTPAIAISAATRHNEHRIVSSISRLAELVAQFDPGGPLHVHVGRGLGTEQALEPRRTADAPQRPFAAGSRT
jgi:uroporphyrin-III C-methyltransferase / precorrin-2 dehydrogenase / sirohydrochlorin ferrochelatase